MPVDIRGSLRRIDLILAGFTLAMVGAMLWVLDSGTRLAVKHPPLIDAAAGIKLEATTAHLWFEEILSGDRHESVEEVWEHLELADWYARVMLEGGESEKGTFVPLDDPELRRRIELVRGKLAEFREITAERWDAFHASAPGTDIDQRYDDVFRELVQVADEVETQVRATIQDEIRIFRRVQVAVILGTIALSILVGFVIAGSVRRRLLAEKEIQRQREQLAHVVRVSTMGEMAAGIAHEVNQPLAAISASAQAARRMLASGNGSSDDIREAMELIDQQAQRAGEVVRGIRSFVTKREGRRVLVDVNDLVRGAVKLAHVEDRGPGARIECRLAEGTLPAVVDVVPMQQVLLNLVRNGMESMRAAEREREAVIVETASAENEILIRVIDRGTGLPPDAEEKLFKPFFTTKEDGMGMGLSISKSILAAHEGKLWFTRNPDRGSTFHVSLPSTSAREMQRARS